MTDELVQRLRVADADTKAIFGEDFVSTQGEAADEIERLTLDWAREQGERTSAELARDQALLEIERLRAEVELRLSELDAAWKREAALTGRAERAESALAALRKRVEEAPVVRVVDDTWEGDGEGISTVRGPADALYSLEGKRVALVVLD